MAPPEAPAVSVNLCCYNSERYLEATLRSVCDQTYRDWELVVVDDGSEDGTAAIVQRFLAEGWPIRYHHQANAGLGRARQRALELSRGEYVALLDHDDVWLAPKLERQVALLEARQTVALVYTDAFIIDAHGVRRGRYFDGGRPARGRVFEATLRNVLPLCLPTVVLRRSACAEAGGFRPYTYAEEYDLFLRIAERHQFDFVEEPLAEYRQHAGSFSRHLDRLYEERLTILDECLDRADAQGPTRRAIEGEIALNHAAYASWWQRHGQRGKAREHRRQALARRPGGLRAYAYCLVSLAPPQLARAASRFRVFVWARTVRGMLRRMLGRRAEAAS